MCFPALAVAYPLQLVSPSNNGRRCGLSLKFCGSNNLDTIVIIQQDKFFDCGITGETIVLRCDCYNLWKHRGYFNKKVLVRSPKFPFLRLSYILIELLAYTFYNVLFYVYFDLVKQGWSKLNYLVAESQISDKVPSTGCWLGSPTPYRGIHHTTNLQTCTL